MAVTFPSIRSCMAAGWLHVLANFWRSSGKVAKKPHPFWSNKPLSGCFKPKRHPSTRKRPPVILTNCSTGFSFQDRAVHGCSPLSSPSDSLIWISANFFSFLSILRLCSRFWPSSAHCAGVRWFRFWNWVHGKHGGDKWTFFGLVFLRTSTAFKKTGPSTQVITIM